MYTREAHHTLNGPVDKIPPELLALVFGFVLGTEPFGAYEYRQFAYLRGACRTWRNVVETTPSLCPGLEIDLGSVKPPRDPDEEGEWGDEEVQSVLAPWLSVVANSPGYHLVVRDEGLKLYTGDPRLTAILRHLIVAKPSPSKLTLVSHVATEAFIEMEITCPDIQDIEIAGDEVDFPWDMSCLSTLFPHLRTLIVGWYMPFLIPVFLQHDTLCKLHLGDAVGEGTGLANLLQTLPRLKELKLGSVVQSPFPEGNFTPQIVSQSHQGLDTLILDGQDMFALLLDISLPSLKLLCVEGIAMSCPNILSTTFIPHFLRQLQGRRVELTISLTGSLHVHIITAFTNNLPPRTRLHFDMTVIGSPPVIPIQSDHIDAIFCTKTTSALHWINGAHCRRVSNQPIQVYVPSEAAGLDQAEARRDEVQKWGYDLEIRPAGVLSSIFRSSIPHTDMSWF